MKIYTGKGDSGRTYLVTGEEVPKNDPRVELYGTADELNSIIGCSVAEIARLPKAAGSKHLETVSNQLTTQQSLLFELGAELAGYFAEPGSSSILESDIVTLEEWIDRFDTELKPLNSFVLPGGIPAAAQLHVARTVCRRLERKLVEAANADKGVMPVTIKYINRLSDYLFVAARYLNQTGGSGDIPWKSRAKESAKNRQD